LGDSVVRLDWMEQPDGWHLSQVAVRTPSGEISVGAPVGRYTLLYSAATPDNKPTPFFLPGHQEPFPGEFTYAAQATDARRLFVVLLNERPEPQTAQVSVDAVRVSEGRRVRWTKAALIDAEGETATLHENEAGWSVPISGFGAAVLRLDFEDN